jgi:hypothetical protein
MLILTPAAAAAAAAAAAVLLAVFNHKVLHKMKDPLTTQADGVHSGRMGFDTSCCFCCSSFAAGFNAKVLHKMTDPKLMAWWGMPVHDEVFFLDGATKGNISSLTSLWDLGNRFDMLQVLCDFL